MAEVASESGISRTGEVSWVFGTIEESFTQKRAGHEVRGHPGLVDEQTSVGLRVFGSETEQEAHHRLGVQRLLLLATPSPVKTVLDGLDNTQKLALAASPYSSVVELLEDCRAAVLQRPRRCRRRRSGTPTLSIGCAQPPSPDRRPVSGLLLADLIRVLDGWRRAERLLTGRADMTLLPALTDMKGQLARLVHRGFVGEAGAAQLRRYPVYLSALEARHHKLTTGGAAAAQKDRALLDQVTGPQEAWLHQLAALPEGRPPGSALRQVRWMLEEFRVSLWAQSLGTAYPVSDQRLRKALQAAT